MMSRSSHFTIRPVKSIAEYRACEEIQRLAWDSGDELVVPVHMLLTVAKTGGLLLGAFDASERLLGFVVGLLAQSESKRLSVPSSKELHHHSHMLGVHPDFWGRGIGYQLKLAQREAVLAQGLELVTWTFDPLERRNATLNFCKLGVICRNYVANLYGDMPDGINADLPSDRFQVEWWLQSERVQKRLADTQSGRSLTDATIDVEALLTKSSIHPATMDANGLPHPAEQAVPLEERQLLVKVPADFQTLKQKNIELARAWRTTTRAIFETAFARGYRAIEYLHHQGRSYYLLEQSRPA